MRLSIPGEGQITKALKTRDPWEAERLTVDIYADVKHRRRHGLAGQARTVEWPVEAFDRQQE